MLERLSLILALILGFVVSPVSAISLHEAIAITVDTNPDILIAIATRKQADAQLAQSYAGYLPTFDISASYGRDKNTNSSTRSFNGGSRTLTERVITTNLTQNIFDGFSVVNGVEASHYRVNSSAMSVVSSVSDVMLRVIEAYLEVVRRRELVELAKENLASHQDIFQQIEVRAESGIGRRADLDQATGRLARARTNLMTEQANLRDTEATFLRVVGILPGTVSRPNYPVDKELPSGEAAAVDIALQLHPSLLASESDVEAAQADKRVSRAPFFPSLNFELSSSQSKNSSGLEGGTSNLSAQLSLSYNLFNGGADTAAEKEAIWALEQSRETRNRVARQIEQSTRLSWNSFTSQRAQLRYFKEAAEASERTRNAYQQQFKIGQRTLLDLLDSENELFTSKSSYLSAQFTEILGRYRVLNSIGLLVENLQVKLPDSSDSKTKGWWVDHHERHRY